VVLVLSRHQFIPQQPDFLEILMLFFLDLLQLAVLVFQFVDSEWKEGYFFVRSLVSARCCASAAG
jgi:hypothetical protein